MARQSLHDVMREVVALYSGAHRDIRFRFELDESLPLLNFDKEQLKRVFRQSLRQCHSSHESEEARSWSRRGMIPRSIGPSCRSPTRASGSIRKTESDCSCRIFLAKKPGRDWAWPSCIALLPIMMAKSKRPTIRPRALFLRSNCRCSGDVRYSLIVHCADLSRPRLTHNK